ncbi:hypothetical protein L3X37_07850 [Sabulilitoribacter arenilitoris]|uniref:MORN repeat protein n=1 Tax=Wocania arenilitoris TaxID=2044858 RepID=A0AAE3EQK2_9FLAO|nr:hypothetical protein [Wocania arenilitoris]MCF7568275.1 hypothetical protein [Wocania arenilitoris]
MKNIFLLLGLICCFTLNSSLVAAQEGCKVLLENISDTYKGECKKGVANGNGIAKGIDSFEGEFKKGYPHGNGTMTYANGSIYTGKWKKGKRDGNGVYTAKIDGQEIEQNGVWKGDKYIGKKKSQMYKVVTDMGVRNYKIRKVDDAVNQVTVEVKRNGERLRMPNTLIGDSGNYRVDQNLGIFTGTNTPFEGSMNFTVNNIGNPGTTIVNFNFIILEPGEWVVEVNINI